MSIMEYIAIISGLFAGWLVFRKGLDVLALTIVLIPYHSNARFNYLYCMGDDKYNYNLFGKTLSSSYVEYLQVYESSKESVYVYFRKHYDNVAKFVYLRLLPMALLPSILFWSNWYLYGIGVFLFLVFAIFYRLYIHENGPDFYHRSIVALVLNKYISENKNN